MTETSDGVKPRTYFGSDDHTPYARVAAKIAQTQGNLWTERNRWRLVALGLLGLAALLTVGMIRLGRQPAYEPVYLVTNGAGQVHIADWDSYRVEEDMIKRDLTLWIRCARGLPNSRSVLERCWRIVPMFLLEGTQARATVAEYFKRLAPDKALFHKSVEVSKITPFLEPDGRWRITFTEDIYELPKGGGLGRLIETRPVTAIAIVTRRKPTKREQIELEGEVVNPYGLYLTHLSWSE